MKSNHDSCVAAAMSSAVTHVIVMRHGPSSSPDPSPSPSPT